LVLERGNWTEAGLPKNSLGEYLVQDGPILTDIQCSIGLQGVTTSYSMQTFVNRAGAFIFENQLRLQTMGKIYQQLRRQYDKKMGGWVGWIHLLYNSYSYSLSVNRNSWIDQ